MQPVFLQNQYNFTFKRQEVVKSNETHGHIKIMIFNSQKDSNVLRCFNFHYIKTNVTTNAWLQHDYIVFSSFNPFFLLLNGEDENARRTDAKHKARLRHVDLGLRKSLSRSPQQVTEDSPVLLLKGLPCAHKHQASVPDTERKGQTWPPGS